MKIVVSESSATTGGQELAVLLHAEGLRKRGVKQLVRFKKRQKIPIPLPTASELDLLTT